MSVPTFLRRRRSSSTAAVTAAAAPAAGPAVTAAAVPAVALEPITAGGAVSGLVTTQDGWPLAEAAVTVLDATGRQVGRTATDSTGAFQAAVPGSGAATVIVAAPGYLPQARAAHVPSRGSFDLSQVVLARAEEAKLPAAGVWTIDPAHSIVRATARHLGLSRVEGRFTAFEGTIQVADPIEDSAVDVSIEASSIHTANAERDAHLRSADFLDAEQFPSLHYRSTGVVRHDDEHWTIHGQLTIRDITREVPLQVTYAGTAPDPWGGTRMAFVASAELARADYEMRWNMGLPTGLALVGPTLRIDLEVQAVQSVQEPDAASSGTHAAQ